MGVLADMRNGIKTNLATISGLRVESRMPGQINPPVAIVGFPADIDYDASMQRGTDEYVIPVRLFVATANSRAADDQLEPYLNKSGGSSVKAAIESDRTLGGSVSDCRVTNMTGVGEAEVSGVTYLFADWDIAVLA